MGSIDLRQEVPAGTDQALQVVVPALDLGGRTGGEDAPDGTAAFLVAQIHAGIVVEVGLRDAQLDAVRGLQRQGQESDLSLPPLGDKVLGIRVLERVEELLFNRSLIAGHIGHIGLVVIREGEFRLLVGDGEFSGFPPAHETVCDTVVIRPEHNVVVPGAQGHLVEMVTDLGPLEVPRRNDRIDTPVGNPETVGATHAGAVQEHHRYLRRREQPDAFPHDGIRNMGSTAHRHDDLSVRRFQLIVLGLRRHGHHKGRHHQNNLFHLSLVISD